MCAFVCAGEGSLTFGRSCPAYSTCPSHHVHEQNVFLEVILASVNCLPRPRYFFRRPLFTLSSFLHLSPQLSHRLISPSNPAVQIPPFIIPFLLITFIPILRIPLFTYPLSPPSPQTFTLHPLLSFSLFMLNSFHPLLTLFLYTFFVIPPHCLIPVTNHP